MNIVDQKLEVLNSFYTKQSRKCSSIQKKIDANNRQLAYLEDPYEENIYEESQKVSRILSGINWSGVIAVVLFPNIIPLYIRILIYVIVTGIFCVNGWKSITDRPFKIIEIKYRKKIKKLNTEEEKSRILEDNYKLQNELLLQEAKASEMQVILNQFHKEKDKLYSQVWENYQCNDIELVPFEQLEDNMKNSYQKKIGPLDINKKT